MKEAGIGYRNVAYKVNKDTHIGEIILDGYDECCYRNLCIG